MAGRMLALALAAGPAAALRSLSAGEAGVGARPFAERGAIASGRSQHSGEGASQSRVDNLESYTFENFVRDFQRTYERGSEQWVAREALFGQRISTMIDHNAADEHSWKMGVSKFTDYTEEEKRRQLGYKGGRSRKQDGVGSGAATTLDRGRDLPSTYNVVSTMAPRTKIMSIIRDQGNCGSCWAEAAVSTFEGQMEVNATLMEELNASHKVDEKVPETPTLSSQAVVSCTVNKRHCGGKGGCEGATAELAYDMVMQHGGLPFAHQWSYEGHNMKCKREVFDNHRINMLGYTILPSNKFNPLLAALTGTGGPIAVSVDATNWFMYGQGVYMDTHGDFTINHAVTLMGYKMPQGGANGYYDIKNSWGSYWGESGHIRILMRPDEEKHCGWDHSTHDGVACDGDPDTAWVCGTCGVLYDSVYPYGLHMVKHTA